MAADNCVDGPEVCAQVVDARVFLLVVLVAPLWFFGNVILYIISLVSYAIRKR